MPRRTPSPIPLRAAIPIALVLLFAGVLLAPAHPAAAVPRTVIGEDFGHEL